MKEIIDILHKPLIGVCKRPRIYHCKVYSSGNSKPESLQYFVETLEKDLIAEGIASVLADKEYLPMQPGDVYQTYADVDDLVRNFGFKASTGLGEGLAKFAK